MSVNSNATWLKLPPVLDIGASPGLLDMLRGAVRETRPLHLDASAVETLTLPCAQILLSAIRNHEQVAVGRPSPEFTAAMTDLGFAWREAPADGAEQADATAANQDTTVNVESPPSATDQMDVAEPISEPMDTSAMSKRILTIDDSRTIRDMLKMTLTDAGFEVLQGVDGEDGLNVLGNDAVDLVITDINMPKMDGYEVIRRLRGNSRYKSTPILVLTTESDGDKRNIARDAGATGWIVKPFDPDRLVETVRKVAP